MKDEDSASSSVQRAFAILRALAATQTSGGRVTHIAKAIGLNLEQFEKDWSSEEVKQQVERDRTEADRLGLQGTPFIWVNGRHVDSKAFNLEEDLPGWLDLEWSLKTNPKQKP